ncbi:MAG: PIG-L family deacetylase [Theionarchaea archaeon]|nr:PIG-L family deacetylase [Theionarchaea archaeon]MBU6999353.1 PIG-L family deacetylase [Theionarchaea archaeon]MBU7021813.1 PIG-L family deacetylase [Theionarchaea archaeon]
MRMIFISAHPDDAFLGAGGIILKHKAMGDDILLVNVTSAEKGLPLLEESFLKAVREKEQDLLCRTLGITVEFLHMPDLKIQYVGEELLNLIILKIRQFAPDLVFTHFTQDVHPDHASVSSVVKTACHLSTFPRVLPDVPHHKVSNIFMWEEYSTRDFQPMVYVDITSEYERKKEVLREYKTQYPILKDVFSHAEIQPRIRGIEAGCLYAEALHCPGPAAVSDLSHFRRRR